MKKIIGILIAVIALGGMAWSAHTKVQAQHVQQGIAEKIIRFHVIANSDSEEDQKLKIQVKNEVVKSMEVLLVDAQNVDQTRQIIKDNMEEIQNLAQNIVNESGYSYPVKAELTHCYFPVKAYGDLTFPDGEYEALRITIGHAEGRNWWCVMYPKLCFVDSLYTVVPEDSKIQLKSVLTDEEYKQVLYGKDTNVKIKSRILECICKYF